MFVLYVQKNIIRGEGMERDELAYNRLAFMDERWGHSVRVDL